MATAVSRAEFDRARSHVYDLLAAAFDGDAEVLHRALEDGAFHDLAAVLPREVTAEGLDRRDLDADGLELGYDNLFVVPGDHYVPPFASAHLDSPAADFESDSPYHEEGQAGELYGDPARRIADLYDRIGFRPSVGEGIPDHVAAELEFMAVLARTKAELRGTEDADLELSLEAIESVEADLLAELRWLSHFADAVGQQDSREGVFAALAEFAAGFVAWDASEHDLE